MSVGLMIGMFLTAAIPTVSLLFVTATADKAFRKARREKRELEVLIDELRRELVDMEDKYCKLKTAAQRHVHWPCNSLGADICVLCSKRLLCQELNDKGEPTRDAWLDAVSPICAVPEREKEIKA